ncbi:MAG: family 78 glycoside hydrolase catalytic domain [Thermoguttaceae bacterium]|nr:family 78 glycoside hydrolase catalytic domain [Thermoguttaceae bacterium]
MRKEKTASSLRRFLSAVLACAVLGAFGASSFAQENTKPIPSANQGNAYPVSVNGFHVVDFRTENLVTPEGVDTPNPRFSWKLFSQDIGEAQSAYQITVTKAFEPDKVVWDTGKVDSDQQLYVKYEGEALEPATEYMVELNVWNKDGQRKSQIYAPFSTGLFPTEADPNPWKGKWIGLNSKEETPEPADISKGSWIAYSPERSLPIGPSIYRKTFEIDDLESVKYAVANFSVDNRGVVYLNGVDIGGSDEYRRAATRVLTDNLKEGKNVIAVRADNVGGEPNPGGIVGAFYVQKADGSRTEYVTDESWKGIEGFEDAYVALDFDDSNWADCSILCKCGDQPWGEIVAAPVEKASPARYLSNVYWMKKDVDVTRAVVFISGLGYNECYLNGEKLGDQVCGPMYTDYDKSVPYNTYDATDILLETKAAGFNDVEIGVVLGNGRYYALRIDKCVHYGDPCLLFQMQVEYADGTKDVFVSDESWKGTDSGPISENNDYDGEVADGRKAKLIAPDSEECLFKEGSAPRYLETRFGKAFVVDTPFDVDLVDGPKGKLVSQMIPPMRENYEIKAVSIQEKEPGRWIIDFGQNYVGVPRIKVKGEAGTKVQIRFAESLIPDGPKAGELYVDNLRTAKARDIYTLYGDPDGEIYEPRFTQHGGRYAELIGYPGTPTLDSVTGYTVTTDVVQTGFFETSNKTISQIFQNIVWGTRGNYLSMPTDCPQRDERMGWQGDRATGSKGEMYIFNNVALYNKWMQDVEESQREDGNVSDVAPAYWRLYSPNVTWPTAQIIIPQSLATVYGDYSAIAKHFDSRDRWLNFMLSLRNDDGTISRDNYGDWCCPPERPELIHSQDPLRQTDRTLLSTSYMINDLRISADFADYLGKADKAKEYRATADTMQEVFNKRFFNAEKGQYDNGSQTSFVLPLAFGLVPENERARVLANLVDGIENKTNMHLGVGLIGAQFINRLLSDEGRIDIPYAFATHTDFPSWGYMITKGATTIWELWNGDTADPAMNSGNHVMLVGDLAIWFFEYLAGIKADPENPGFKHMIMRPNVVGDLTYVNASYDSARGLVKSSWKLDKESGKFVWNITIPANTTATVSVPTSNPNSLEMTTSRLFLVPPEPGEIRFAKYDTKTEDFDVKQLDKKNVDGRVEFELGCGNYEITAELK